MVFKTLEFCLQKNAFYVPNSFFFANKIYFFANQFFKDEIELQKHMQFIYGLMNNLVSKNMN